MKKGKLIAGIIWLIIGGMLVWMLIGFIQRLLIAGTELINGLGGMTVSDEIAITEPTAEIPVITEENFDAEPVVTMEPEELFSIPVEETAEELARENEQK